MSVPRVAFSAAERAVFALRLRSVRRSGAELVRGDPIGIALVTAALAWVLHSARETLQSDLGAWASFAVVASLLWTIHGARKDRRFLHIVGARARHVMTVEYLAAGVPAAAAVLAAGVLSPSRLIATALIPIACIMIAHLPARAASSAQRGRSMLTERVRGVLPPDAFEAVAALRSAWPAVLALQAVLSLATWRYPDVALAATGLLALVVAGWYGAAAEGRDLVVAFQRSPRRYLAHKCAVALRTYLTLAAPVVLSMLLAHADSWRALLVTGVAGAVVVAGAVLVKYASFAPGRPSPVWFAIVMVPVVLSLVIPPASALILVALWWRAGRVLGPYIG